MEVTATTLHEIKKTGKFDLPVYYFVFERRNSTSETSLNVANSGNH
jgi:hypothetical protein